MLHDFLIRVKNATRAGKEAVHAPYSRFDFEVAKFLAREGFVASAEKRVIGKKSMIEVRLRYENGKSAISDFKIISKPSRRLYAGYREMKSVRQGYGTGVISTPAGVLSDKEVRKKKVGGEYLFEVW